MRRDQPTRKQLDYLADLKYKGVQPTSSAQASLAITEMLYSGSSKKAELAILKQADREATDALKVQTKRLKKFFSNKSAFPEWLKALVGCVVIISIFILLFVACCCVLPAFLGR